MFEATGHPAGGHRAGSRVLRQRPTSLLVYFFGAAGAAAGLPLPRLPCRCLRAAAAAAGAAVASVTRLFTKLFFAAPAKFFSAAWSVQVFSAAALVSLTHFLMKLSLAAPANFFSAACA